MAPAVPPAPLAARLQPLLTCPSCSDIITPPAARLGCSHRFCESCIRQHLGSAQRCPACSARASRRSIMRDPCCDRILVLYVALLSETTTSVGVHVGNLLEAQPSGAESGLGLPVQPPTGCQGSSLNLPRGAHREQDRRVLQPLHTPNSAPPEKRQRLHAPRSAPAAASRLSVHRGRASRWARSAKWTLLGSGLDKLETGLLKSVAALTGSQVVKRFSADVTHVICHLDDHHRAMRKTKLLLGMLRGKWVVGLDWVRAVQQAGHAVSEADYEVQWDTHGQLGTALGRLHIAEGQTLLHGFEVHVYGQREKHTDLEALVQAAGASLLARLPPEAPSELPVVKELQQGLVSPTVVVLHSQAGSGVAATASLSSCRGPEHLHCDWLLDSAAAWEIKPFDAYRA